MELLYFPQTSDNIDDRGALKEGFSDRDLVHRAHSSDHFQLAYALEDLALEIERQRPDLAPGRYPAELLWSEARDGLVHPVLRVCDASGTALLEREYPLSALRGSEVYGEAIKENAALEDKGKVFYLAVADDGSEDDHDEFEDFFDEGDDPELPVNVSPWPAHEPAVDLGVLATLGAEYNRPDDLPVLCVPEELERVARAVGEIPADDFVEVGWYLVGRQVRNGATGDLMLVLERAVLVRNTRSNASTLVIPAESQDLLAAELKQVNDELGDTPLGPLRKVGWLHLHDMGAIAREESEAPAASEAAEVPGEVVDGRFFSLRDEKLHRGNYPAASIALVLDAAACRKDPTDLERCYAAFGTIRGTVVRRGLHLLPRQKDEE